MLVRVFFVVRGEISELGCAGEVVLVRSGGRKKVSPGRGRAHGGF